MLIDLVKHVESKTGLPQAKARAALGILFNAADRQSAPMAEQIFNTVPGARTLSAQIGHEIGAATGDIARLIEKTPGGRRYVTSQMIRSLHNIGLGHETIGQIFTAVSAHMQNVHGMQNFGTLGDFLGTAASENDAAAGSIAA